jgi:hypothetical protein
MEWQFEAGEMIRFEAMIRPIKALAVRLGEIGNRIGPQLRLLKAAVGIWPRFLAFWKA